MRKNYFLKSLLSLVLMFVGINVGQAATKTVTYTVDSKTTVISSGDVPAGSSATFLNTGTGNNDQVTKNKSMTLTLSGFDSTTITGLTLSMKSNTGSGAGSFSMTCGTTSLASIATAGFNTSSWYSAWSTSFVNIYPSVTSNTVGSGQNIVITIVSTENSLYCQSFTLTYEDSGVAKTPTVTSFGAGAQNSYDAFLGEGFTAPTATVDNSGTVTYGSSSTSVATVDPATGAVTLVAPGSTTITASYAGGATYAPSSASYTLNVVGNVYNNLQELQAGATTTSSLAKITFNNVIVTGIKNTSNAYISDGQYGAMIYTSGHGLTAGKVLNGTIVAKVVLYNGATEITNFSTNGLTITDGILTPTATTISSITLPNQSRYIKLNDVTYDATAQTFTDGTSTIAFYDGLTTGMRLVDGVTYNITGVVGYYNKLQVFPAIADALPTNVAISAAGYATFVAPFDINATAADVTVYTINTFSSTSATLTPVTLIPKGTVVLLKGSAGTHSLSSDANQTYTALEGNLLQAASVGGKTISDTDNIYILGMPSGQPVGFYKSTAGTLAAGKGYLDGGSIAQGKFLDFSEETTGIDKVNTTTIENNVIYNLNGQKIYSPVKGINLINGKKVLIK